MLNREATKEETISAGLDMMSRANPKQQENHAKAIEWIKTLKQVPSTFDPTTTYNVCLQEWYAIHVKGQPNGTGAYKLETI